MANSFSSYKKVIKMLSENQKRIKELSIELGKCLYQESKDKDFKNLGEIEETVRELMLNYVSPEIGIFLSKKARKQVRVVNDKLRV
jgi:hypothetical protein